ncbi:MAG: hypothetical protein ACD_45C00744G0008 [uncultured bacterium]|nr:MAG: hypothetical protein ACD_45C00744G0008 [uncultured bacterium]
MMNKTSINFNQNHAVIALLRFNIRWYGRVMKDILIRYKLFVLFLMAMMSSSLTDIFHFFAWPVKNLVSYPVTNRMYIVVSLATYQSFALLWVALHQLVLFKQPWKKYLLSLQISNIQKFIVDVMMLFILDMILWVPILFAGVAAIYNANYVHAEIFLIIEKCVLTIIVILFLQVMWIKRKYTLLVPALLINVAIFFSILLESTSQIMAIFLIILFTVSLMYFCYQESSDVENGKKFSLFNKGLVKSADYYQPLSFYRIQIKNMIEILPQLSMMFCMLVLILLLSVFLMAGKVNHLLLILSSIMLLNSLTVSNLFKRIHSQRDQFSYFFASLPMTRMALFTVDFFGVAFFALLLNMIIVIAALFIEPNCEILTLITALLMSIVFLAITYFPQIKLNRYGFFSSFCLMFLFFYINYMLFNLLPE